MEKTALLKKHFELVYAVAAELLVLEVDRVPGSFLTIQDIDCPGIRIPGHDQGQQGRRRQFDPANDLDVFGSLISPATAVCSSTPGSTCSAGSTIIVQTLQSSFPGSSPTSCCCSEPGRHQWHIALPVSEKAKSVEALVSLEVLMLRGGDARVKIVKQGGLDIKDAHRTPSPPDAPPDNGAEWR